MLLKAGLIVAVFMHMLWERLAMVYAILVPTLLLMVLLGIGALEAVNTFLTRGCLFPERTVLAQPESNRGEAHLLSDSVPYYKNCR